MVFSPQFTNFNEKDYAAARNYAKNIVFWNHVRRSGDRSILGSEGSNLRFRETVEPLAKVVSTLRPLDKLAAQGERSLTL